MEISGAQPLRHLRTSCRALRGAASGVVSVSVVPVYNAADFVCALSHPLDEYCGDELDLGVHRGRCFAFPDEADLMNKMLLAAAVLVFLVSGTNDIAGGPFTLLPAENMSEFLSGGGFGPEASLAALVISLLASGALLWFAWGRGDFVANDE
jgi:hypothetical protein